MTAFPLYEGAAFGDADVQTFLTDLAAKGWKVFADRGPSSYVLAVDDEKVVKIIYQPHKRTWRVTAEIHGGAIFLKKANTFNAFKELVAAAAQSLGASLEAAPKSIRLYDDKPVSNRVALATLAHGTTVKAIFDPYFNDAAIANLKTLTNLGLKLAPLTRILMTAKTRGCLSDSMLRGFEVEVGVRIEVRLCESTKEHRRFFLLTSGDTIVIGCSLNSLEKNEAAHVEFSVEDQQFFDEEWKESKTM